MKTISGEIKPKVFENEPATFEEAVTATKFGRFNIILACLSMLASLCALFDTTSMSYTFVAAQCDLDLSLSDKGILNSITYIGMVSSAVVWGFLFDVLGRKKLLTIGFLVDSIFVFTSALSQNFTVLLISKFFQGFIINGPFAALSSYMSEFHCAKYRPAFQLLIGTCISFATLVLPLIAWTILPRDMDFTLIGLDFHSWNVFLLTTGLPAFLCGVIFLFFPESPKFLMTCGQNEKALAIFRRVYSINTGLPEDTYPIKNLVEETKINNENSKHGGKITAQRTKTQALKEGFQQIQPLFFPPHLTRLVLVCSIIFFNLMSLQMIRLWLPQIFQIMTDYIQAHNGTSANLCIMLETVSSPNKTSEECFVNTDNSTVYINSAIVGFAAVCICGIVGIIIHCVGKKKILLVSEIVGCVCCISIYFANYPVVVLISSAIFVSTGSVSSNVTTSITIDLFPTYLRTLTISLGMMTGRIGAMVGNFIFPFLLESGCEPPFFVVAGFLLVAFVLSLFIPNTDNQALA